MRRRRRKRLVRGLLLGGAAVGLPALANTLIARRSKTLSVPSWGRARRYAWTYGEVAYQDLGRGVPLLLLHSLGPGHDAEEWRQVAEHLASSYRVVVLDLLGWGRSDKPALRYDSELYLQLIADFLEDVVDRPAILMAAGLSAAYAVQLAVDRPEAVRSLVLSSPLGIETHGEEPDLKDALLHWALKLPILGTSALNLYTSRTALGQYLRRDAFASPELADAGRLEHHYRSSHQRGTHASLAAVLAGYANHSVAEALARCGVPMLLVWGRGATHPTVETADLWLQRLPEARLEVLESSGNLPHLEEPGRFARRVERFLERTAASGDD
ncbi:MAG: alpha/beta hydrolase [Thermoanaerobaculia bacterium]